MGLLDNFIPPGDRRAALLLYGMVFATCFNGYYAGIMTTILEDEQFTTYYHADSTRFGIIQLLLYLGGLEVGLRNCLLEGRYAIL